MLIDISEQYCKGLAANAVWFQHNLLMLSVQAVINSGIVVLNRYCVGRTKRATQWKMEHL